MPNKIILKNFNFYKKILFLKSIISGGFLYHLASGISKAENLLTSHDVMASIKAIKAWCSLLTKIL